jgi:NitT/TauT family transport system ATP-binding protein
MTAASSPGRAAIQLRGIRKQFGGREFLLSDFDLTIEEGESALLVGPSGSGKTTLLNIISLIEPVDAGQVLLGGVAYRPEDIGKPKLAYIFQRDALLPWGTVGQNMMLGIEAVRRPGAADRERARSFLARVGLEGYEDRHPATLSGGQRQLVAIVQNLLLDPDILLLDEPFSHVDFPTRLFLEREVIGLVDLARRSRERPMTLLMVTHDIEEAIVIGSRVISLGRSKGEPLRIVRDAQVDVPASDRDPILLRGSELLREHFREIWESLTPFAPSYQHQRQEMRHDGP